MAEELNFAAWLRSGDIQTSIRKCQDLFNSGIFSSGAISGPLFEPAVIMLLINMNDLLAKSNKDQMRVAFADDVELTEKIKDVTDLIRESRNAACHIGSPENLFEGLGKFTFNVVSGLAPEAFNLNGIKLGCDFADDIAVYYGEKRVYLRRHLLRALEAVAKNYPAAL
ncbi:hypothetical protein YA0745_12035 [Pseudomonas synxantha]|uniref:Reverse transcriptase domain-containing protein n=1 Tax=Pseudomonas synxantha TaxID=47883 RepID=A0ABS0UCK3_9PSED|nr:hypothetical protein [Pseudomonas synxantha]MBI6563311.1 hypothetical protein [Pseudomonas synxantha]MBI6582115.1 hypothetical protein [Pseudomonas synxantha]MBI6643664.1 hypothetical protein [Pseudomonas synxantha]